MAFRRSFLDRHGLFDPHFGLGSYLPGGDETDRFYAVLRTGGKIFFDPDAWVEHIYAGDQPALHSKIRGYAAAQTGLFTKWFLSDPPIRPLILRYATSRILAVLKPSRSVDEGRRTMPPRGAIIAGSLTGPFAYLWSRFRAKT
jgi:hypothetical protein